MTGGEAQGQDFTQCHPGCQDLRVPLHVIERLETAGSLRGWGPSDSLASAQYHNPGLRLACLQPHLRAGHPRREGGQLARSGQVSRLQILMPKVGEWMEGARWVQSEHFFDYCGGQAVTTQSRPWHRPSKEGSAA